MSVEGSGPAIQDPIDRRIALALHANPPALNCYAGMLVQTPSLALLFRHGAYMPDVLSLIFPRICRNPGRAQVPRCQDGFDLHGFRLYSPDLAIDDVHGARAAAQK